MDWKLALQIAGTVLGLLYLWLEYRANIWLWAVGAVMPVVHGVLYFRSGLYADCAMQTYYVLAAIYGFIIWYGGRAASAKKESAPAGIRHTPLRRIAPLAAAYALLHGAIYWLLVRFTDSTVPFWDALTTALCIVAYWMLSHKYVEQWLVWLAVDAITVGLYAVKGIPLTAALYGLYCLLAVAGYRRWLKEIRPEKPDRPHPGASTAA